MNRNAVNSYMSVKKEELKEEKSSYEVVALLLNGLIDKVTSAIFSIKSNDVVKKGEAIGVAISVLEALKMSLDKEAGGQISENLENLYTFCIKELLLANIENSVEKLENVLTVIQNIKEGWDGIEDQVK